MRSAKDIWEIALGVLEIEVTRPDFKTWYEKTDGLNFADGTFVVGVPNWFIAEYLQRNRLDFIKQVLNQITHCNIESLEFKFSVENLMPEPAKIKLPLFSIMTKDGSDPGGINYLVSWFSGKKALLTQGNSARTLWTAFKLLRTRTELDPPDQPYNHYQTDPLDVDKRELEEPRFGHQN